MGVRPDEVLFGRHLCPGLSDKHTSERGLVTDLGIESVLSNIVKQKVLRPGKSEVTVFVQ